MNATQPFSPVRSTDHLGRTYPSLSAMCRAYHISLATYRHRVAVGMDVETALTAPVRPLWNAKPATDHTGREFRSVSAMCAAWGIAPDVYCSRLRRGMNVKEALSSPVGRRGRPARRA